MLDNEMRLNFKLPLRGRGPPYTIFTPPCLNLRECNHSENVIPILSLNPEYLVKEKFH